MMDRARGMVRVKGVHNNEWGGFTVKLSAPTQLVFIIAVILVVLAIVSIYVAVPYVSAHAFWVAIVGFAVLAAGCLFRNT